jgi:NlpC/P60 family
MRIFYVIALLATTVAKSAYKQRTAVIKVAVADALTEAITSHRYQQSIEQLYRELPLCSSPSHNQNIQRAYQFLFNEPVTVINETHHQVACQTSHVFYHSTPSTKNFTFWTLKKNVAFLDEMPTTLLEALTPTYSTINDKNSRKLLTLLQPWQDPTTGITYSCGTRFVRSPQYDTKISYAVLIIDHKTTTVLLSKIPRTSCFTDYKKHPDLIRKDFVAILKKWTLGTGFFPYLWGGCSGVKQCYDNNFKLMKHPLFKNKVWSRGTASPLTGFDCSGLILRAAQTVGAPYFFRNTTTFIQYLKPLGSSDTLQEGDLIWFPGHVMVVSNIKQNELIEARGYDAGYGKVQVLKLKNTFKNISTYKKLSDAYKNRRPLELLRQGNKPYKNIIRYTLFKFSSIWDTVRSSSKSLV